MDCRTCVYSDWNYPSTECRSCRGYGNYARVLPTITNEYLVQADDEMELRVLQACDTANLLTELMMFGDGDQCVKASRLLAKLGKAMALNVHDER